MIINDQQQTQRETKLLQDQLQHLAPEVSVDSETYRHVPITEFGAAMLRGMGWTGTVSTREDDMGGSGGGSTSSTMPRPARLGLGATPKLLDQLPKTHNRRIRRQDQVKRDEQLRKQQEEYQQQQLRQVAMDKQQTLQIGSIVQINDHRAIIRQLQGVPGLNMILVQFENLKEPTKVQKGQIRLIPRKELETQPPFQEPEISYTTNKLKEDTDNLSGRRSQLKESSRKDDHDRRKSRREEDDGFGDHRRRSEDKRKRDRDDDEDDDDDTSKNHEGSHHRILSNREEKSRRKRSLQDEDGHHNDHEARRRRRLPSDYDDNRRSPIGKGDHNREGRKERRSLGRDERIGKNTNITWAIPNIRVRVVTSKFGRAHDKQKGVVVDVTHQGVVTLKMDSNTQVLQVPERYLETALPKVGGNAICLSGEHRFARGRLLERDSRACKGVIQIFEDMSVVTLSLDDLAEWCGPLDDDLME